MKIIEFGLARISAPFLLDPILMKTKIIVFAFFAAALSLAPAQESRNSAAADPQVIQELKELEQHRAEAFARRDIEFIDRTTADDCSFVHAAGDIQTKAHELAALKSSELTYNTNHLDEVSVRLYGDTAVLTGLGTKTGVRNGVKFNNQTRFTRVYVKMNGQWRMVASQTAVVGK
ncbi:MAG: nuclear transport factor 2 family protein [Verrucomicrobia bacterium]|nr:nuclear transport factor 2 family protein [Verrucomicrobiota bacterium]